MRRTRQVPKGIAMRFILTCCIVACCWGRSLCVPQQFMNEFKSALLPLFGLKERPRIDSGKVQVPEALKELYRAQTNFQWDTASLPLPGLYTGSANTVRSFTHEESPIDDTFTNHHKKFRLKFNISSIPQTEQLKAAEMKLTRQAIKDIDTSDPYQRVLIIDILKRGVKGSHGPLTRVIDSKLIDIRKNSTISVDVFPAVERWLSEPSSNHGILVTIHTAKNKKHPQKKHLRLRRDLPQDEWSQKQPILFTYTDDGRNKQRTGLELTKMRNKRAPRKHRKIERNPCQRQKMYVDFQEVGWSDWIVAPLGYQAFYCGGECEYPMPDHMNTTNHAIVQSLMNSARPTEVPKPCCVPTQLSSMSMLYVDSKNNVILKNYKEMVVVGCGCR